MDIKNVKSVHYVGVDIALRTSGIAVADKDANVLGTTLVRTYSTHTYIESIYKVYSEFFDLFTSLFVYAPHLEIAVEDRLQVGWSGTTLASIEGARIAAVLAIKAAAESRKATYNLTMYPPSLMKTHFAGKGNASKLEMRGVSRGIDTFKNLEAEYQDDIWDAIFLILYHKHLVETGVVDAKP